MRCFLLGFAVGRDGMGWDGDTVDVDLGRMVS